MIKKVQEYQKLHHTIAPVYDNNSKVLILGSFPSVKSREMEFFYGHPQNRFWKVVAYLTGEALPQSVEEKKALLLRNRIAIWDVIESCEIIGSSDSSIRNVVPTNIDVILQTADIEQIFVNGGKAYELYYKYTFPTIQRDAIKLPSTSPANAVWNLERLCTAWEIVQEYNNKKEKA